MIVIMTKTYLKEQRICDILCSGYWLSGCIVYNVSNKEHQHINRRHTNMQTVITVPFNHFGGIFLYFINFVGHILVTNGLVASLSLLVRSFKIFTSLPKKFLSTLWCCYYNVWLLLEHRSYPDCYSKNYRHDDS
jgi:hypothetical protein